MAAVRCALWAACRLHLPQNAVDGRAICGYGNAFEAAEPASLNAFNKQSAMRLGISVLLSSFAAG
eukprot:scaffold91945_cov84-Phaeocystis_antarctica.AAC.1